MNSRSIGNVGERLALNYLISHGFSIIERNVYLHWGEIDIIAKHSLNIFFFEVKFSQTFISPESFYSKHKKHKLLRTINLWLNQNNASDYSRMILGLIAIHRTPESLTHKKSLSPSIKVYFEPLY